MAEEKVRRFAEGTDVPMERSRKELEDLLRKHKATEIGLHMRDDGYRILYKMRGRMLRLVIAYPDAKAFSLRNAKSVYASRRTEAEVLKLQEQEWRRRWRAALLILKARLEAVASGDADFEATFLGDIVLPNGETLAEAIRPQLARSYESGEMPPLMLGSG